MPTVGAVQQAEMLMPLPMSAEDLNNQGDENYNMLARLKPGVTIAQAQAELDLVVRQLEQQYPDHYPASRRFSFSVRPLLEQVVGDVRPALLMSARRGRLRVADRVRQRRQSVAGARGGA